MLKTSWKDSWRLPEEIFYIDRLYRAGLDGDQRNKVGKENVKWVRDFGFLYSTDFLGETSNWGSDQYTFMYGHNNVCILKDLTKVLYPEKMHGTYVNMERQYEGQTRRCFWAGSNKSVCLPVNEYTIKMPILVRNGLLSKYNPVLMNMRRYDNLALYVNVDNYDDYKRLDVTCLKEANIAACTINQSLFVYMVPSPKTALKFPEEDSYKYYLCLGSYKYAKISSSKYSFCDDDKYAKDGDIPQNALIGIGTDKDKDEILKKYTFGAVPYLYYNNYIVYAWCEGENVHIGVASFGLNDNECVRLYTKRDDIQKEFGFSFPACRIISVKIAKDRLWIFYFSKDHYDLRCFNVPMSEVLKYSAS